MIDPYVYANAVCPSCGRDCRVCRDDEDAESLVCDECLYEEWGQPLGSYQSLPPLSPEQETRRGLPVLWGETGKGKPVMFDLETGRRVH